MEYYDDVFCDENISEADRIIEEAIDNLSDLFKDEAQAAVKKAHDAKHELAITKHEIEVYREKLEGIKSQIEQAKQYKAEKVPLDIINRIVEKCTGGFSPGEEVYFVKQRYKCDNCEMCDNRGKISARIDDEDYLVPCPKCKGHGYIESYVYDVKLTKIRDVHLELSLKQDGIHVWNEKNVYIYGCDSPVPPDLLFKSKEDAEEYKKKKEEKEKDGD